MKKVLSLLLVLVMVFAVTGCQRNTEPAETPAAETPAEEPAVEALMPEEGAELVVWESPNVEGEFMKMVAEEFEAKYGVKVTYEEVNHTDAKGRLAQDGPNGVGADVFAAPHDHTGELVASGLVMANEHGADRVKNDYVKAAYDGVTFEGKTYGFPLAIETYALYYNKDIYTEAPKSFSDIIAKAGEWNDLDKNQFALMWDVGNAYFSHGFIVGGGGYIFGNNGTDKNDIGLANEGAIAGANQMLALKEILPLNSGDTGYSVMTGLFYEGKVGAMINGPWAVQETKDSGVNFGIVKLPTFEDGSQMGSFSGIRSLFVSAYTQYPNAAQLFAEFATSDEMLLKRFETTKQIPPVKALMTADAIANDEFVAPFLDQAQYAVPMPLIPQMGYVWTPYGAAFGSMWNDGIAPAEALGQAVELIKEQIASEEE